MAGETSNSKQYGDGRMAFIAKLDEVKKLHSDGATLRRIYREFFVEEVLSYPQFVKYCAKFVCNPKARKFGKESSASNEVTAAANQHISKAPETTTPKFPIRNDISIGKKFHHDPTPLPKEQLI
jgi:hypothetical protein